MNIDIFNPKTKEWHNKGEGSPTPIKAENLNQYNDILIDITECLKNDVIIPTTLSELKNYGFSNDLSEFQDCYISYSQIKDRDPGDKGDLTYNNTAQNNIDTFNNYNDIEISSMGFLDANSMPPAAIQQSTGFRFKINRNQFIILLAKVLNILPWNSTIEYNIGDRVYKIEQQSYGNSNEKQICCYESLVENNINYDPSSMVNTNIWKKIDIIGGSCLYLEDLQNIKFNGLNNGDVLSYDASEKVWKSKTLTPSEGGIPQLITLTDVSIDNDTIQDGDVLTYNADTQLWEAKENSSNNDNVDWSNIDSKPFEGIDENDFKVVDNTLKFNKTIPENISDLTNDSNFLNSGDISCTPIEISGEKTKIADITIEGETTSIYIPNKDDDTSSGSSVEVTTYETTGTHIADITVDGVKAELFSNIEQITKAQYDELPDTKLTDGVPRLITDWTEKGSYSGSSSNNIYSLDEVRIGTFLDKPLYRRMFPTNQTSIATSVFNVDVGYETNQMDALVNATLLKFKRDAEVHVVTGLGVWHTPKYGNQISIKSLQASDDYDEDYIYLILEYTKVGE